MHALLPFPVDPVEVKHIHQLEPGNTSERKTKPDKNVQHRSIWDFGFGIWDLEIRI